MSVSLQGVESERCASFQAALAAGHPVKIEANQSLTLADGKALSLLYRYFKMTSSTPKIVL